MPDAEDRTNEQVWRSSAPPQFSIIIPSFQRRDLVVSNVRSLSNQDFKSPFEVIVVVDGSTDGSTAALRRLVVPFHLSILEQSNQGVAAARNKGASEAAGEILLFLDDDMSPDPSLLSEHERSRMEGAEIVFGHLPVHPESPSNFLSSGVKKWAENRAIELSSSEDTPGFREIIGGQLSIPRELFSAMGGFDTTFTRSGTFGNEDMDLAIRLLKDGRKVAFNPRAISHQRYVITPRQYLVQYRQAGRADVILAQKHPEKAQEIYDPWAVEYPGDAKMWRYFRIPARWIVLGLLHLGMEGKRVIQLFWWVWRMEYCHGVREQGGNPRIALTH